jgi:PKD repeat protein
MNSTLIATQPGLYWVEVSKSPNCRGRDSVIIDLLPMPMADFSFAVSGGQVQFTSSNPGVNNPVYSWDFWGWK